MAKKKMKKFKGFHNLSAGLFGHRGWYWYKNVSDFWILIKRVFFTLNHGYAPQALWETDGWFVGVMREILTNYKDNRVFTGFFFNKGLNEEEDIAKTDKELEQMIRLLDKMDMGYCDNKDSFKESEKAKNKFFILLSKYFFYLWE
nr:MAG TPA: hypothetical protein [Caudoviricetes sp.]